MTRGEDAVMLKQAEEAHDTKETGFALILAILALLLLTFLGLTLAVSTSTELQIAQNYRWSRQALYNAEAGVEIGKSALRGIDWSTVLPAARTFPDPNPTLPDTGGWIGNEPNPTQGKGGATAPLANPDAWGNPSRNFENYQCDLRSQGMGYGVVLDDGTTTYQYLTTYLGQNLNGAVTLWVRRLLRPNTDGTFEDYAENSALVLVSEGVAPYAGGTASSAFARSRQAVQVIEVVLSGNAATDQPGGCTSLAGQAGGSQFGAGLGGCGKLDVGPNGAADKDPNS
jgi:PilX N-terminal